MQKCASLPEKYSTLAVELAQLMAKDSDYLETYMLPEILAFLRSLLTAVYEKTSRLLVRTLTSLSVAT